MKLNSGLCIAISLIIAGGYFQAAYGLPEVEERAPVRLPQCGTPRAKMFLNQAIFFTKKVKPLRIDSINDAYQTNLAIFGTRKCSGSLTSIDGLLYTGVWSFARSDDINVKVEFSIQPVDTVKTKVIDRNYKAQ